jgi:hypothetical protein
MPSVSGGVRCFIWGPGPFLGFWFGIGSVFGGLVREIGVWAGVGGAGSGDAGTVEDIGVWFIR